MTDQPKTLLTALLAVQAELPNISLEKKGKNPAFKSKYLTLDGLHRAIIPLLNRHSLVWTTQPAHTAEGPYLGYALIHAPSGERIEGMMPLMLDKQNSQGLGSAITYARRYSLLSVIGAVGDEDDDGQKASEGSVFIDKKAAAMPSEQPTKANKRPEDRLLKTAELGQIAESVGRAGKTIEMAAKAVGKDDPYTLTEADGWEILRKIKEKDPA